VLTASAEEAPSAVAVVLTDPEREAATVAISQAKTVDVVPLEAVAVLRQQTLRARSEPLEHTWMRVDIVMSTVYWG
jgi:hypothetical protein